MYFATETPSLPRSLPANGFFICATARNEAKYIREWVAYHLAIGFDHIFLFDNDSTDNLQQALVGVPRKNLTYRWWPRDGIGRPRQHEAYVRCHKDLQSLPNCWILFLDIDEFLVLKKHRSIQELVHDLELADAIAFNWRMFGDSGHRSHEPGLVMRRFTQASVSDFSENAHLKTMARCSKIVEPDLHWHRLVADARAVDPEGRVLPHDYGPIGSEITHLTAQVNHYFTKSFQEWRERRSLGRADKPVTSKEYRRPDSQFHYHNKNDVADLHILERLPEVEAILASFDRRTRWKLPRFFRRGQITIEGTCET